MVEGENLRGLTRKPTRKCPQTIENKGLTKCLTLPDIYVILISMMSDDRSPPLRDEDSPNHKIENTESTSPMNSTKNFYIRDIPADLHRRLKVLSAHYGKGMREIAIDAIEVHVNLMEEKLAELRQTPDRFNVL